MEPKEIKIKVVLVVDDYEGIREAMQLLLESYGIFSFTAKSEEEVIKVVNNEELDAIIIELALTRNFLTNPSACKKTNKYIWAGLYLLERIEEVLKNKSESEKVNVIIHTSLSKEMLMEDGFIFMESEVSHYLTKGVQDSEILVGMIND